MTTEEFSNEFDIMTGGSSFDEYTKSVFLTDAQEDLVKAIIKGDTGNSFETTEDMREALSNLVITRYGKYIQWDNIKDDKGKPDNSYPTNGKFDEIYGVLDGNTGYENFPLSITELNKVEHITTKGAHFFLLDDDVWQIVYEAISYNSEDGCDNLSNIEVVPVKHDIWHKVKKNPFKGPNNHRALRLDLNVVARKSGYDLPRMVEIVTNKTTKPNYIYRYIRRPNPIILVSLQQDNLSINGKTEITQCTLPRILHRPILKLAVQRALALRSSKESKNE